MSGINELTPTRVLRVRRLRRVVKSYAEQLEASNRLRQERRRWRMWFLTLTYRDGEPWEPNDVRAFIQRIRVWAKRQGVERLPYLWVMELHEKRFQRTGICKPHYHVLIWLPPALSMPKPDKRGWWRKGHTNRQRARTVGYLLKYTSKAHQCDGMAYPAACRVYGCGGIDEEGRKVHQHVIKPAWIRERIPMGEPWRRVEGGVLRCRTGEWWECPYVTLPVWHGGEWAVHVVERSGDLGYVTVTGETNIATEREFTFAAQLWIRQARWELQQQEIREESWRELLANADEIANASNFYVGPSEN